MQTGALDWATALEAVDGDRELLGTVLEGFLGQQEDLCRQLRGALASSDLAVVERVAHTIGGSLRLFDGAEVVALAGRLEHACRAGHTDGLEETWRELEEALGQVLPELQRFVDAAAGEAG